MRAKLFFILALLLSADIALADSFTATGSVNLTIGTSGVSGTAGLLYGDGATLRSLPGTVTIGSNYKSLAVGNNVQLSLTTDGTSANFAATLALINTNTSGGWGNALEVYSNLGGLYALETYINGVGIYYSRLNMVISGHVSPGEPGLEVNTGADIRSCLPTPTIKTCMIVGPTSRGPATPRALALALPASCPSLARRTLACSRSASTPRTVSSSSAIRRSRRLGNILSATRRFPASARASRRFGNASAGGADFSGSIKLSGINDQGFVITKSRVVSASTDTVSASTDYFVCVAYTSTGAVTETLPAGVAGQTFLIKDCGGAAATHAITITPASGTIDGGSSYSLSTNYGSVAVTYVNSQWSTN